MCGRQVMPLDSVLLVRQEALLALLRLYPIRNTSSLSWVPFLYDVLVLQRLVAIVRAHGRHGQARLLLCCVVSTTRLVQRGVDNGGLAVLMRWSARNLRSSALMKVVVDL